MINLLSKSIMACSKACLRSVVGFGWNSECGRIYGFVSKAGNIDKSPECEVLLPQARLAEVDFSVNLPAWRNLTDLKCQL